MRYIRLACIALFAIALILVGLANRQMVTLRLVPPELSDVAAVTPGLQMPLFVVILLSIATGLLVGIAGEWLREHKHRADAARRAREVSRLEQEVRRLKGEKHAGKDDVLALLE